MVGPPHDKGLAIRGETPGDASADHRGTMRCATASTRALSISSAAMVAALSHNDGRATRRPGAFDNLIERGTTREALSQVGIRCGARAMVDLRRAADQVPAAAIMRRPQSGYAS